jgi:hypothetical protein
VLKQYEQQLQARMALEEAGDDPAAAAAAAVRALAPTWQEPLLSAAAALGGALCFACQSGSVSTRVCLSPELLQQLCSQLVEDGSGGWYRAGPGAGGGGEVHDTASLQRCWLVVVTGAARALCASGQGMLAGWLAGCMMHACIQPVKMALQAALGTC